jgi:RND superfamily putative drug exporter
VSSLGERISQDNRFSNFTGLERINAQTGLVQVYVNGDTTASAARDAVSELRGDYVKQAFAGTGASVSIGGTTAETIDGIDIANKYLPIVIAFVLTLSFVLLTVVFRSVVIPAKALVMNLLSVGAAYGVVVAVFQKGFLADTLGFSQTGSVSSWLPVFLFAVLFGLSMDYHVFLLSRIQERFLQTRDNRSSVAHGLQSTAHIITGAAAIMVVVFGTFALGDLVEIQQMGFGLAVAVFIDATLIRSILVPASMEMLGDLNWYLPRFLSWLPRINIEGTAAPRTTREYRLAPSQPNGELAPVHVEMPWD